MFALAELYLFEFLQLPRQSQISFLTPELLFFFAYFCCLLIGVSRFVGLRLLIAKGWTGEFSRWYCHRICVEISDRSSTKFGFNGIA